MKRNILKKPIESILICILLLSYTTSNAQERIGINCTNPSSVLEIRGNEADLIQTINNTNASNRSGIQFQKSGRAKITLGLDNSSNYFQLGTTGIGTSVRFSINTNGNIGIGGVTNAVQKLHVQESGAQDLILLLDQTNAGDYDNIVRFENGTTNWSMGMRDVDADQFSICNNADLSANQRMIVKTAGNVGFGTTSVANSIVHLAFNTAGSDGITMNQGDATNDNVINWKLNGTTKFGMGIANSLNNEFQINNTVLFNTTPGLCVSATGNVYIASNSLAGGFAVKGTWGGKYTSQSVDYTATASDFFIESNSAGAARTIMLPAISGCNGRVYIIKRIGANNVTVDPDGAETIDGAATYTISADAGCVWVINDGGDWKIICVK